MHPLCASKQQTKLCCCQPRNSCSPDSNDRIKERPVSGHYTHLSTHTHKNLPLPSHHGDPSEGRRTLAHGREVVEKRRAAVRLTKRLHLLHGFGHRLQDSLQNGLKRKETTPSFSHIWSTLGSFSHSGDIFSFKLVTEISMPCILNSMARVRLKLHLLAVMQIQLLKCIDMSRYSCCGDVTKRRHEPRLVKLDLNKFKKKKISTHLHPMIPIPSLSE